MIVVDTNVVLRLLMGGEDGEAAARLHERDEEWAAPNILPSELRNALLGYVRRRGLSSEEAKALVAYAAVVLADRTFDMTDAPVIDTALECGLTAYDAEFVALARALGVGLVTMDAAILRGAPDVAAPLEAFAS